MLLPEEDATVPLLLEELLEDEDEELLEEIIQMNAF